MPYFPKFRILVQNLAKTPDDSLDRGLARAVFRRKFLDGGPVSDLLSPQIDKFVVHGKIFPVVYRPSVLGHQFKQFRAQINYSCIFHVAKPLMASENDASEREKHEFKYAADGGELDILPVYFLVKPFLLGISKP